MYIYIINYYNLYKQCKDLNGSTAYLHAASIGDNKYLSILSESNSDIFATTNNGRGVLHEICNPVYDN